MRLALELQHRPPWWLMQLPLTTCKSSFIFEETFPSWKDKIPDESCKDSNFETWPTVETPLSKNSTHNRFSSRSTDQCKPFFTVTEKSKGLLWTDKCEDAFTKLKEYLSKPPLLSKLEDGKDLYLYLSVSDCAVSTALIREDLREQKPVFYMSKALLEPETGYQENGKIHTCTGDCP